MFKRMEKIVVNELHQHLEINNLTEAFQSAYGVGHSTKTALLRVQND